MKALIKYIDFHMDNYQGASGKTVEGVYTLDVPDSVRCGDFFEFMHAQFVQYINERRPFGKSEHGYKPTIVSVEIV